MLKNPWLIFFIEIMNYCYTQEKKNFLKSLNLSWQLNKQKQNFDKMLVNN